MYFVIFAVLSGCAVVEQVEDTGQVPDTAAVGAAPPPPASARTVEDFDTTSAKDRAEAAAVSGQGRLIGETVASLGDPSMPGFWLVTPLVNDVTTGQVALAGSDAGVEVELRPGDGGSSRISLAALRLLGAPLTDLVTLEVFAGG